MQSWKSKQLSRASKTVLLKSVIQSIPNHCMSVYLLPKELCYGLERMMNSFWWGNKRGQDRGIIWQKWKCLCKSKSGGGLGFRCLHEFNIAPLGKQAWKLLLNPNSMVSMVLKARYYPNSSYLEATLGNNPSYIWRCLLAAQDLIRKGTMANQLIFGTLLGFLMSNAQPSLPLQLQTMHP